MHLVNGVKQKELLSKCHEVPVVESQGRSYFAYCYLVVKLSRVLSVLITDDALHLLYFTVIVLV